MKYMLDKFNRTHLQDNSEPTTTSSGNPYQVKGQVQSPVSPEVKTEVLEKKDPTPVNHVLPTQLKAIRLSKTSKTPKVFMDHLLGKYLVSGRSLPEDAIGFYQQVTGWLEQYAESSYADKEAQFEFELEYFNTSSSKCLLDVFKVIAKMYQNGKPVQIIWRYDMDDEDLEETGEDYRDLLDVPFVLEGVEY